MIKIISIAISSLAVLLVSLFSSPDGEISIKSNVAPRLIPGDECTVTVTLVRGDAAGYARLQQILPMGLTAKPIETMGAKFQMEGNVVKFEWTSLPEEESFAVSYKFQTDPNETERELMPGSFYYLKDGRQVKVELEPVELDFTSASAAKSGNEVERKIFAVTPEGGEYKVVISITRRSGENTARFTDDIPDGYTVTNVNASGSKFMFSNHQATFTWDQLPDEPVTKISYNLQALSEDFENPVVTGLLVYGGEEETRTSIVSASADVSSEPAPLKESNAVVEHIAANLIAQASEEVATGNITMPIPAPQKGIFFKIQIAATRKSPIRDDNFFREKYSLDQHVDLTEHEGWRKYMIGNFDSYLSASSFTERTKEKIPGAFVVAYKDAMRISIREAMGSTTISN